MKKFFVALITFFFLTEQVNACSCKEFESMAEMVDSNDAIFRGIPIETKKVDGDGDEFSARVTKFIVTDALKGQSYLEKDEHGSWIAFIEHNPGACCICGFDFHKGIAYEVFANEANGSLGTSLCNGTRPAPIPEYEWSWDDFKSLLTSK